MLITSILFMGATPNTHDKSSIYHFEINGREWATVAKKGEDLTLLDRNGCPAEPCDDHDNILEILRPYTARAIWEGW